MGGGVTFSVTILGSSGSYAAPDNPCTGYLLRSPGATVLLDCGPGTVGPLQTEIDLLDLDAIVLTHCHPDHWMELPVLRNVFTYFAVRTGLPVFGTAETKALNDAVTISGRAETFDWTTIDPSSTIEIGDQSGRSPSRITPSRRSVRPWWSTARPLSSPPTAGPAGISPMLPRRSTSPLLMPAISRHSKVAPSPT